MTLPNKSSFIDIGSGFGKPVFHSAMQTGCRSYGVEIVPARVAVCQAQQYDFADHYKKRSESQRSTAAVSSVQELPLRRASSRNQANSSRKSSPQKTMIAANTMSARSKSQMQDDEK